MKAFAARFWFPLALVFLIVPIFLVPFLEERFERRVPRIAPKMANHVIVYRYGPAVETLLQRLADHDVASIVVETDCFPQASVRVTVLPDCFVSVIVNCSTGDDVAVAGSSTRPTSCD